MCTTITFHNRGFLYFGRNMDIDYSFGERIVITPRNYPFKFRKTGELPHHYAMIGTATVVENYPLYAEACNEKGLCMAGLNFPVNACYFKCEKDGKYNITPFEFIPWILGKCANLREAKELLSKTRLISEPFSENLPLAPLHWHIADISGSVVFEQTKDGARIYENPVGVMTNNPPFNYHLENRRQYMNLSNKNPVNGMMLSGKEVSEYGLGLGGCGLPGDFSSASRFIKAAFLLENSAEFDTEEESAAHVFRMLESVSPIRGSVLTSGGKEHYTTYSCCIDADKGTYYFRKYGDLCVRSVLMREYELEAERIMCAE